MDGQSDEPRDSRRRQPGQPGQPDQPAAVNPATASGDPPAGKSFDPRGYLRPIRVRGGQTADYLDVKWRLVWLRSEHPDAQIRTEHIALSEDSAVFKASVEISNGGCATGYGSEHRSDFADFIEKAETKAIGRALAALGYGTQFALDFDLEEGAGEVSGRLADAPVDRLAPRPESAPRPIERPTVAQPEAPAPVPAPLPTTPRVRAVPSPTAEVDTPVGPGSRPGLAERRQGGIDDAPPPNVRTLRDDRPSPAPTPEPAPAPTPSTTATPPDREPFEPADYSWTEFWKWARALGYKSRTELGELLGIEVDEMTPHEVRRRLIDYRRAQGLDA